MVRTADKVKIVEVGPRDGLQNESHRLKLEIRRELIHRLGQAGLKYIEIGAFVSPQWVPQMKDSNLLIQSLIEDQKNGKISQDITFSALVPNIRGIEDALKTDIKKIAIFGSCSEGFSKKNINCTITESFIRFQNVMKIAQTHNLSVRGYLSTAFGCPYDGYVDPVKTVTLAEKMLDLGVEEVSLGDTIGVATPLQVENLLNKLLPRVTPLNVAMHFHDTRGTALANVVQSYQMGIRTFDTSVGGLGGCPYAQGASGNLATEDLVYLMEGMGIPTGLDLEKLIETKNWIEPIIGRKLLSHVGQAGLPLPGTIRC